jgi:hypothetical protein
MAMLMDGSSKTHYTVTVLSTGRRRKAGGGAICADKRWPPRILFDLLMFFGDSHRVSVESKVEA